MINAALLDLGVTEQGETPNATESNAALTKLNQLAGSWDIIRLDASSIDRRDCALNTPLTFFDVPGSGSGTHAPRPIAIESAEYVVVVDGTDEMRWPLKIVGVSEFLASSQRGERARVPSLLYYDANWPTASIQLYPRLLVTTDFLRIYYWRRSISVSGDPWVLATTLDMPPGYELALRLNLAVQLASSYGRPLDPTLATDAANALAAIRGVNAPGPAGGAEIIQGTGLSQPVPPDAGLAIPK